jgi:hypothetical protein
MADTKISELPVATAIASPDVAPVVQSGITKQADVSLFGPPFVLNPNDVLAKDENANVLVGRSSATTPTELVFTSVISSNVVGQDDDTTNLLNLNIGTSGTPQNGMGGRILIGVQDLSAGTQDIGIITAAWYDIDNLKGNLNFAVGVGQADTMTLWPSAAMSIDGADDPGEGYVNVTNGYKINGVELSDVLGNSIVFPDSDPHIVGAGYWLAGVLTRSAG